MLVPGEFKKKKKKEKKIPGPILDLGTKTLQGVSPRKLLSQGHSEKRLSMGLAAI